MDKSHQIIYNSTLNSNKQKYYTIICHLLNNDNKTTSNPHINSQLFIDLDIFSGNHLDISNSIWNLLNFTSLNSGLIKLQQMVSQPSNNIAILTQRQKYLVSLQPKYHLLTPLLNQLPLIELDILDLWNNEYLETINEQLKIVYFQNKYLSFINKKPYLIGFYLFYRVILAPILGVIAPIVYMIIPFLMLKLFYNIPLNFQSYYQLMKLSFNGFSTILPQNKYIIFFRYLGYGLWIFSYLQSIYNNYEIASNTIEITNKIHTKMNNISRFVRKSIEIIQIIYPNYQPPIIYDLLNHSIFSQSPSLLSSKGVIIASWNILIETKEEIIPILKLVGDIDAHISILTLKSKYNFTFSKYWKDTSKPKVYAKNLYHPILLTDNKQIITNNIKIGIKNNPNNMIITGPNAAGKSTFIKSLVLSILLSQTFTITPCTKFYLTPFSIINTYLNIPDEKGKDSLFQAEMNRAISHLNILRKLPSNQLSFIVMDEIFSSTNPEEAIAGASSIAELLSSYNNSISIITTHFKELTNISKHNSKFINYYFPVNIDTKEKIEFLYTIKKGISNQYIALYLLKEHGLDKILIDKAIETQKKLIETQKSKSIEI